MMIGLWHNQYLLIARVLVLGWHKRLAWQVLRQSFRTCSMSVQQLQLDN
jgi:hypothetical protein